MPNMQSAIAMLKQVCSHREIKATTFGTGLLIRLAPLLYECLSSATTDNMRSHRQVDLHQA